MKGELIWEGAAVIGVPEDQRRKSIGWLIWIVAREERISRGRA